MRTGARIPAPRPRPGSGARRAEWVERAACRDAAPAIFYPTTDNPEDEGQARQMCRACPVQRQCREAAIANGEQGIWGDTNEADRRGATRRRTA